MILIVGLGNPGKEFENTRHNIGFSVIDSIQKYFLFPKFSKKFNGFYSKKKIFNKNIVLFKPMKFMNLSGEPTYKIFDFFKIKKIENIIVFHDDLDLNFLKVRVKKTGGHGGHNGIKNIIEYIGKDFNRIKIGIKNAFYIENQISADKFVLGKFSTKELNKIESLKKVMIQNFELIINKNFSELTSKA